MDVEHDPLADLRNDRAVEDSEFLKRIDCALTASKLCCQLVDAVSEGLSLFAFLLGVRAASSELIELQEFFSCHLPDRFF